MNKPLPKNVFLEGIFEPLSVETDITDFSIIGKIPQELNGTFYRNGPNPQYVYSKNYHMFEGDGMIHAMTFNNGRVRYKNRWIRTEKFKAERTAKKSLFGGMRDSMVCDESVQTVSRNTANTNVIWHHHKLLALNEGSPPAVINKDNLIQCKNYDFNKMLDRSMMAHPKIDPITGELIFYSYFSADFMYFISNKHGEITHKEKISMPHMTLMHDFAITKNFTILPVFPLTWDFQRLSKGEQIFKWEANLNTRFAIIPRYGKNIDVIWFEDKACLGFHTINAYEDNENIILEMVVAEIPDNAVAFADDNTIYPNHFTRWIFNLKTKKIQKQRIDDTPVEFPTIDQRVVGHSYQHAYMASTLNKQLPAYSFDSISHYDRQKNKARIHNFGADALPLEPIFVPRTSESAEGDGFLLTYVYRQKFNRSDLVIIDASKVSEEPIAIIQLPHRVPFGFHGCWSPI